MTLIDLLNKKTKEELQNLETLLMLPVPAKFRKADHVQVIHSYLINEPQEWLSQMPYYELTLLLRFVEKGPDFWLEEEDSLVHNMLELIGVVIAAPSEEENGKILFLLPKDLHQVIAPYIKPELTKRENTRRFFLETIFLGIANLHGQISFDEVLDLINEYMFHTIEKEELERILFNSIQVRSMLFEAVYGDVSTLFVRSSFLENPENLDLSLLKQPFVTKRKFFTKEETLAAGEYPIPRISAGTPVALKRHMIDKLGYSEDEIPFLLLYLWYTLQEKEDLSMAITTIIRDRLTNYSEYHQSVALLVDYCEKLPRWTFLGYSSKEYISISEQHLSKNQLLFERKDSIKGLCACGSGKKYEKCCGSN